MSDLNYTVLDFADSSLNKTSVLVTGEHDAVVVDAAFTRADGHRIVAAVLDAGKTLRTVVVSGGDPDFYFGAEVIADAFPEAAFVAPADVIEHIAHSYEGKLEAWAHSTGCTCGPPTARPRPTALTGSRLSTLSSRSSPPSWSPDTVRPARRPTCPRSTTPRGYLRLFEETVAAAADAAQATEKLLAAYPDAGLVIAAELGTKVAKGELTWG